MRPFVKSLWSVVVITATRANEQFKATALQHCTKQLYEALVENRDLYLSVSLTFEVWPFDLKTVGTEALSRTIRFTVYCIKNGNQKYILLRWTLMTAFGIVPKRVARWDIIYLLWISYTKAVTMCRPTTTSFEVNTGQSFLLPLSSNRWWDASHGEGLNTGAFCCRPSLEEDLHRALRLARLQTPELVTPQRKTQEVWKPLRGAIYWLVLKYSIEMIEKDVCNPNVMVFWGICEFCANDSAVCKVTLVNSSKLRTTLSLF